MWKEFKQFIMTGNVIDFAIAVILAGAVGAVVNGFVEDVMMPFIGQFSGGADFSDLKIVLSNAVLDAEGNILTPENAVRYGAWINTIVNLFVIGGVLFWMVRVKNKINPPAPAAPKGPSQEELLTQIRDLLKK